MNSHQLIFGKGDISLRWMTRLLSIVISSVFLLIVFLAVTNEDKPQGVAILILTLLGLTIMGCFISWRWEKFGGIIVVIGALCLSIAAYSASLTFGVNSLNFLLPLIYGTPFLIVGILFWVSGQRTTTGLTK